MMATSDSLAVSQRKNSRNPSECQICGASALYSYYSVIVCPPCKMFFKRNADSGTKSFKCNHDDHCIINTSNRYTCSACRLKKCFEVGMKIEMIRRSIRPKKSQRSVLIKKIEPVLNLSDNDLSSLHTNQWILLSHLIHSYDESQLFSIIHKFQHETELSQTLTITHKSLLHELLYFGYKRAGMFVQSNADILHLSSDHRTILLQTAVDNVTCLGGVAICCYSQLFSNSIFYNHMITLYGTTIMHYYKRAINFIQSDIATYKLSLALFMFSSTSRTMCRHTTAEYENISMILNIENKYAELTWQYLVYKYGYQESVRRYMKIIECFLAITLLIHYAQENQAHANNIDSLIEQTEIALLLDDINQTV